MTNVEFYRVGGCVRDELMGVPTKDIDYVVVAPTFEDVYAAVEARCTKIIKDKEGVPIGSQFYILRGIDPDLGPVDFGWSREDGPSSDGRHPDWVKGAPLEVDLARRDFTMNAIAQAEDGTLIDPFDGQGDIKKRVIRFVGDPYVRLQEDALRAYRAVRFEITKDFKTERDSRLAITNMVEEDFAAVSTERIREELVRCFAKDSELASSVFECYFPDLLQFAFNRGIWLKPTLEERLAVPMGPTREYKL